MNITKYFSYFAPVVFVIAATTGANASATNASGAHVHGPAVDPVSQTQDMSEGEIKKVDKNAGRVTIKHGPLQNLGMPGMTMTFDVKDTTMLESVKVGDKIQFVAEQLDGKFVVTKLNVQQ